MLLNTGEERGAHETSCLECFSVTLINFICNKLLECEEFGDYFFGILKSI